MKRDLARLFVSAARHLSPPARKPWADALGREVEEIADDGAALGWAFGAAVGMAREFAPRIGLAAVTAGFAATQLYPAILCLAWRSGNRALLAWLTPQTDYRQFIPLLEKMTDRTLILAPVMPMLFMLAAVQLLRRKASAGWLFTAGLGIVLAQVAVSRADATYLATFPPRQLMIEYALLGVLGVMLAMTIRLTRPFKTA